MLGLTAARLRISSVVASRSCMPRRKITTGVPLANNTEKYMTQSAEGTVKLTIHARPGAKVNCIKDISSDVISVDINAPPAEGKANTELCHFIASILGVPKRNVSLIQGHKSRNKTVAVQSDDKSLLDLQEKLLLCLKTK